VQSLGAWGNNQGNTSEMDAPGVARHSISLRSDRQNLKATVLGKRSNVQFAKS